MSRQLAVNFINNSGLKATVSVGFLPGPPAAGEGALPFSIKNLKDGSEIDALDNSGGAYPCSGQWYTLDDLSAGVEVSSFSGRIYVCYDTPWTIQHQAYEPGQAVTDPNFFLRYDKMEMTFTGSPSDVADLTSIDYWSIPMT
ncbi:MAG: hypothetical protein Q8K43_08190, partial [Sulfurimicrobium sp.]|nr:hypothetical protein [Sulfurimicrobium sp.]